MTAAFYNKIKAIDVLVPLERGGKGRLFGGAGVGKTVLLTEMIHNMIGDAGVLPNMVMVFGQMNVPGLRRCVLLFQFGNANVTSLGLLEYQQS